MEVRLQRTYFKGGSDLILSTSVILCVKINSLFVIKEGGPKVVINGFR